MKHGLWIVFLLMALPASSQMKPGTRTWGIEAAPRLSATHAHNYNSVSAALDLNINTGKFVASNLMNGFIAGFIYNVSKNSYYHSSAYALYAGFFTRKYQPVGDNKFGLFLNTSVRFQNNNFKAFRYFSITATALVQPGVYLFVNEKTALEVSAGNAYLVYNTRSKTLGIGLNTNPLFQLGLRYYPSYAVLSRKKNTINSR